MKQALQRTGDYLWRRRQKIAHGLIFLAGMIGAFDASSPAKPKPRALSPAPRRRSPKKQ